MSRRSLTGALVVVAAVAPAPAGAAALPPAFEGDRGQLAPGVRFAARAPGHELRVTDRGARVAVAGGTLTLRPVGARGPRAVRGERRLPGVVNVFGGGRHHSRIPRFERVRQREVWPGVDVVYRLTGAALEYDLVVRPGADLDRVRIALDGATDLQLDARGALVAGVGSGSVRQAPPVAYQGGRRLAARFVLGGDDTVSFSVSGRDRRRELVIDPVLSVSGFMGGSFDESASDVAVDAAGNVYVTGWTTSRDFPTRNPLFAWDEWNAVCGHDTCPDAFVAKYAPGGRSLIYATFLAGDRVDRGNGVAVDAAGHAYVAGNTTSTDFPTRNAAQREYRCGDPYGDAFVAKLAPDGSALEWSTYHGGCFGNAGETARDIALDQSGNAYIAGYTDSFHFPTTSGAADRVCAPEGPNSFCGDAFAAKFSATGALLFSTFFGGNIANEGAYGIAVDSAGRPVIAGSSQRSEDFPTTPGAYDPTPDPYFTEAWAARLRADGSAVEWATTFGGNDWDDTSDVAVDSADRPVVVGTTESRTFPTTAGALDRRCNDDDEVYSCTNHSDGFVTTLAADGSAIAWSTFLGGAGYDEAHAVAVDPRGDVYVTGSASSERAFPLREAFQADERGGEPCGPRAWCADAFLVRLSRDGGLLSGTLLGGASMDSGNGVAIDPEADAWVTGLTHSMDFPATADAVQPSIGGGNCSFYRDWYEYDECSDGFLSELDPAAPPDPPVSPVPAQDPGASPSTGASSPAGGTTTSPSTAAGPSGTVFAARSVTLARTTAAFVGRVRADRGGRRCTGRIPLMLERRSAGAWHPVRRLLTRLDGRFKTAAPARRGRYRVRAPRLRNGDLTCRAARSPTVRAPSAA